MARERNRWLSAYALIVYAFLFAPIVVLIIFSFNKARRGLVWQGFTLDWYPKLLANDELLDALIVTLKVAAVSVLIATVLGALLAFSLSFDDYVVTTFIAGVGCSTLPLYIYGKIKFGVTPEINAISTIIVAVTAIAILIAWRAGAFDSGPRRPVADEAAT
jgi:ABC-type spermidine/putrescine transport system permease subunit II